MTRLRVLIVVLALGLVAAGCGSETAVDRTLLRYGYAPGDSLTYDATGTVAGTIVIEGEIEPGVPGGIMDIDLRLGARIDYEVFEGSDPTISIVRITQQITAFDGSITGMGEDEEMTLADLGDDLPATTVEVIIDAQGDVLSVQIDGTDVPLGDFGGLTDVTGLGGIGDLGGALLDPQHLGPRLPDEPVGVGDRWTIDQSVAPFGFDVTQQARYEVVAAEVIGTRSTMQIDARIATDAVDLTIAELAQNLLGGLGEGSADDLGIDPESLGALFEAMGIQIALSVNETTGTSSTLFDPSDGIVVRHDAVSPLAVSLTMSGIPDVGDAAIDLDVTVTQSLSLVE